MKHPRQRGNSLDGRTWTRYSISVWSDIRKSKEELALKHPALFPVQLPQRLIECFLPPDDKLVLDPFCGLGSTVLAAHALDRVGIGLDINADYVETARQRLGECSDGCRIVCADAGAAGDHLDGRKVDLVITSPPYWDILTRKRSADRKEIRNYGNEPADLGRITDYDEFLGALGGVFGDLRRLLRPGGYCVVAVMDIRKGKVFHPFHSDLARVMQDEGYLWDDTIIWDRRHEYNNLRPLGYPSVFRINKAHEYLLIFQKPRRGGATSER